VTRSGDRPSGPKPLKDSAARRVEAIIEGAERAAGKVIDDAEAQARAYVAEAEAEADRAAAERLAAAGELAEALLRQADAIRRQAELLADSLREASGQLGEGPGAALREVGSEPGLTPVDHLEAPGAPGEAATNGDPRSADDDAPEDERRGEGTVGAGWRLRAEGSAGAPRLTAVSPSVPAIEPVPERRGEPPAPRGTPAGARLLATQMAVSGSSREEIAARLRSGFEIDDTDAILDAILGPQG
jgi:vacuolar-type H+-ATPase subunit H